ncbi:MAG TPA: DUF3710 domain-containing protein [Acidothermaceae bacterium]|jgi:hypothetical protein|nr:DUF3710 domain-containing protein [Acidothermaceae bacterium]
MAFRRGKKDAADTTAAQSTDSDDDAAVDDDAPADDVTDDAASTPPAARSPIDEADAGTDEVLARIDLGGLRVPVLPGTEVRVELNQAQVPIAATIVHNASSLQVLAFAAPRNDGIWDEVRSEIAEALRAEGSHVDEVVGGFGPELRTRARAEAQEKPGAPALRFVGFDGPRWFVRGVFSGPAATDVVQAAVLETVLTSIVVVRGNDPMAPRDQIPLRLPKEALTAADPAAAAAAEAAAIAEAEGQAPPQIFAVRDRSREITETS